MIPFYQNLLHYSFSWVPFLSLKQKKEILFLMNHVIYQTDTLGFQNILSFAEGMRLISHLNSAIKNKSQYLLLVRHTPTNTLIGHVVLAHNQLPNCFHRAEIFRAIVHPDHRHLLLLKKGLYYILEKCHTLNISSLELDVRVGSPLSRLWKMFGFEIMGENPDYARINGQSMKGFYMRQSLENLKKYAFHDTLAS